MRYPAGFLAPFCLKEMAADILPFGQVFSATRRATQQCQCFVWVVAILPSMPLCMTQLLERYSEKCLVESP
jgi:hypothetical protein